MIDLMLALLIGPTVAAPDPDEPLPVVRPRQAVTGQNDEAYALGHTGSVKLRFTVQPDGTRSAPEVIETSRSDLLDADAVALLEGATVKTPETASIYEIEVEYLPYDIVDLKCDSAARQTRWFQETWPQRSIKDMSLYSISSGLMLIGGGELSRGQTARNFTEFEAGFLDIIATCEAEPGRRYGDVLGAWMRR